MNVLDMLRIGTGMAGHENSLKKKYGITIKENLYMAYRHETPYAVPNILVDCALLSPATVLERPDFGGADAFGVEWVYDADSHAPMPVPGKYVLEDITEWKEKVHFPDLDAFDWKKQADLDLHQDFLASSNAGQYVALKNGKTAMDGGKVGFALIPNGMFERMHELMGFENALASLAEEPEACFEFFSAMADYKIKFIQKVAKYYPVEIINAHDDYSADTRMFMSMNTWRELIKPNLKRIVDATHDLGLIYQHHSCGYIEPLIPELIELGVDAVDPLSPFSNPNAAKVKHKYEKQLTFVNCADNRNVFDRPGVTFQECKDEYRRTIDTMAPGGSFIGFPTDLTRTCQVPCLSEHFRYGVKYYDQHKGK